MDFSKKRLITILSVIGLLFMLGLTITSLFLLSNKKTTYDVRFYDNNHLVGTITKDLEETISKDDLSSIENGLADYSEDYLHIWSYRKDHLVQVNFEELNRNADVYLYKVKGHYQIIINEADFFTYSLLTDSEVTFGSDIVFDINPTVDLTNKKLIVIVNNVRIKPNSDGHYHITNVNEDITINVTLENLIEFVPQDITYTYNGNVQTFAYAFNDSTINVLPSEVKVSYYRDSDLNYVVQPLNAGKYYVLLEYLGSDYYIDEMVLEMLIDKAVPIIDDFTVNRYYNGTEQRITISDVVTNSNGNITIAEHGITNVGEQEVIITIAESNNYLSKEVKATLVIEKAIPVLRTAPATSVGFVDHLLKEVKLIGGQMNVDGHFEWSNGAIVLSEGTRQYSVNFIPNDVDNYQIMSFDLSVNVISTAEMLRRIKVDRELIFNEYSGILKNNINNLPNLLTDGPRYESNITWIATSTAVTIDKQGNTSIINQNGSYEVTLLAYIIYGDAAEYVQFNFILEVNNQRTVKESSSARVPSLTEIKTMVENKKHERVIENKVDILDVVITKAPTEVIYDMAFLDNNPTNIKAEQMILETQEQEFTYHAKCRRVRVISEIILWRIISDGAADGSASSLRDFENSLSQFKRIQQIKIYQNSLKGEIK